MNNFAQLQIPCGVLSRTSFAYTVLISFPSDSCGVLGSSWISAVLSLVFLCRIFKLPFITLLTLFHVLEIFPEIISRTWNVPRNFCVQWRVSVCTHRANVAQGLYVAIYCFACSSLYLTCYVLSIFQFLQQAHKF